MTRGKPTFEDAAHAEELWVAYSERFKRYYLKHKHKPMFSPMFQPRQWRRHHEYSLEGFAKFLKVKRLRLKEYKREGFRELYYQILRDIRDWENERPEVGLRRRAVDDFNRAAETTPRDQELAVAGRKMMGL